MLPKPKFYTVYEHTLYFGVGLRGEMVKFRSIYILDKRVFWPSCVHSTYYNLLGDNDNSNENVSSIRNHCSFNQQQCIGNIGEQIHCHKGWKGMQIFL